MTGQPKLEAYIDLETSVAGVLRASWEKAARPILAKIVDAAQRGRFDEAMLAVDQLDLGAAAKAVHAKVRELGVSAMLFGASRLVPVRQTFLARGGDLPPAFENAVLQLIAGLQADASLFVRREIARTLSRIEDEDQQAAFAKSDNVVLFKATDAQKALAARINDSVIGSGRGLIDIAANLSTSRLVSYGFLAQARSMNVAQYQVSEVLDARLCPVCRYTHGKTFDVSPAHDRLEQVLMIADPATLKAAAPWPKQDKESLGKLYSMSPAEMRSRGWDTPPYHPGCRGVLVPKGTVDDKIPYFQPAEAPLPVVTNVSRPVPVEPAWSFDQLREAMTADVMSGLDEATLADLLSTYSPREIEAALRVAKYPALNDFARHCMGKTPFLKADQPAFCVAYDPTKILETLKLAETAVDKKVLSAELVVKRKMYGKYAGDLIDQWDQLEGAVLTDPGFVTASYLPAAATAAKGEIDVVIRLKAGQEVMQVKLGGKGILILPKKQKLLISKAWTDVDGSKVLEVEVVDEYLKTSVWPPKLTGPKPAAAAPVLQPNPVVAAKAAPPPVAPAAASIEVKMPAKPTLSVPGAEKALTSLDQLAEGGDLDGIDPYVKILNGLYPDADLAKIAAYAEDVKPLAAQVKMGQLVSQMPDFKQFGLVEQDYVNAAKELQALAMAGDVGAINAYPISGFLQAADDLLDGYRWNLYTSALQVEEWIAAGKPDLLANLKNPIKLVATPATPAAGAVKLLSRLPSVPASIAANVKGASAFETLLDYVSYGDVDYVESFDAAIKLPSLSPVQLAEMKAYQQDLAVYTKQLVMGKIKAPLPDFDAIDPSTAAKFKQVAEQMREFALAGEPHQFKNLDLTKFQGSPSYSVLADFRFTMKELAYTRKDWLANGSKDLLAGFSAPATAVAAVPPPVVAAPTLAAAPSVIAPPMPDWLSLNKWNAKTFTNISEKMAKKVVAGDTAWISAQKYPAGTAGSKEWAAFDAYKQQMLELAEKVKTGVVPPSSITGLPTPAPVVAKTPPVLVAPKPAAPVKLGAPTPDDLNYADLKYVRAKPGGSVPGNTYVHLKTGEEWIVKYVDDDDVARNEVLTAKLYEALGVKVPDLRLVKNGNKTWVASKMIPDFVLQPGQVGSGAQLMGLQEHFVADSWLANWDVAGLSFDNVGFASGKVIRIDVGAGLRYRAQGGLKDAKLFGRTVGEIDSLRNPSVNAQTAKMFAKVTDDDIKAGVKRLALLPDAEIRRLVQTYGPVDAKVNADLVDLMLARKADLMKRFPDAVQAPPAPVRTGLGRVAPTEVTSIKDARLNGRVVITDKDGIEDQHVLFHVEKNVNDALQTVATFKVRGPGAQVMMQEVKAVGSSPAVASTLYDSHALDNKMIETLKGVLSRTLKGEALLQKDLDRLAEARSLFAKGVTTLNDAVGKGQFPSADYNDFITHYGKLLSLLENAVKPGVGNVGVWTEPPTWKWAPKGISVSAPLPKSAPTKAALQWTKVRASFEEKALTNGEAKGLGKAGYTANIDMYEAIDGNVRIRYIPENVRMAALRNRVEIQVLGEGEQAVEDVYKTMEKLGLDADLATPQDMEDAYLTRLAFARVKDWPDFKAKVLSVTDRDQRLAAAKGWWTQKLGRPVESLPGYDPQGQYQAFDQGRVVHFRPDLLADPAWPTFEKNHRLVHRLYSGNPAGSLDRILSGGGSMAPTTDKLRRGITPKGMSPESDLGTGGADYFFTRINTVKDAAHHEGLVWKVRQAARVDAISYDSDLFGETSSEAFILKNRKSTIKEMEAAAQRRGNETILKNSLSLFDDLDGIQVATKAEKQAVLDVLKKHKITVWPDGRTLDQVVRVI